MLDDKLVKDLLFLPKNKESTALIAYLNADGQIRKGFLKDHAARQQRVRPLPILTQRTPLFQAKFTVGTGVDNRASTSSPNNLNFKNKRVRHSFNDGYHSLMAVVWLSATVKHPESIYISEWNASTAEEPIPLDGGFEIWKTSETSFGLSGSQTNTKYLHAIYGYRVMLQNPNELQFSREIGTYRLLTGQTSIISLPEAIGGTPPYTYTLEGVLPGGLTYYPDDLQIRGSITSNTTGLNWVCVDAAGDRISEHFDIEIFSTLTLGRSRSQFSTTGSHLFISLGQASGGVQPYTHFLTERSSSVPGQFGSVPVTYSFNPDTPSVTITYPPAHSISSGGNQGQGSFTHGVRDALGYTVTQRYGFSFR